MEIGPNLKSVIESIIEGIVALAIIAGIFIFLCH